MLDAANSKKNFLSIDKHGNRWYQNILSDGRQVWVRVRKGKITDAGINDNVLDIINKFKVFK